ncbi:DUF4199 domain-containing protein [Croceitalea marina]|uniref:DUF4199 domain-containing protein n=1 Tax=Croceitalea marina TaxID=1775166 RepID=A0ABW5N2G2_9FLAO
MKKTVLRFGIYGAITICLLFLLGWYIGKNLDYGGQEIIGYASMVISLGFVYFGIKHYRDKENEGTISFKKALIIGLLISLITALAFGVLDVIYIEFLNPDFTTDYYATAVEEMRNTMSAEEFEVKLAELESQKELFSNPLFSFLLMAFTVFIIGFIISLISSLILQRK